MGFFQSLGSTFKVIMAFFPNWFVTGFVGVIVAFGVWAAISIVAKLKDLFWPF